MKHDRAELVQYLNYIIKIIVQSKTVKILLNLNLKSMAPPRVNMKIINTKNTHKFYLNLDNMALTLIKIIR